MDKINITPAVPTENTENKEVEKNVLTKEQVEELKKNLSPEELKQFEILESLTSNGSNPEEIHDKVSRLTNDQLSCAVGGLKNSPKETKEELAKKIKWNLAKIGISGAISGASLVLVIQGLCDLLKSREENTAGGTTGSK